MFPIRNDHGDVIAFSGRQLREDPRAVELTALPDPRVTAPAAGAEYVPMEDADAVRAFQMKLSMLVLAAVTLSG